MRYKLLPLCFFSCLFCILCFNLIKQDTLFSENENRVLEQKPILSKNSFFSSEYTSSFETYVTDQMIFRDFFVQSKGFFESVLGKKENHAIYFGKENFLLPKNTDSTFDLHTYNENVGHIQQFLTELPYPKENKFFLPIPSSDYVNASLLPNFAVPLDQKALFDKSKQDDFTVVDLFPVFEANQPKSLYYKTDHHWTSLGAYYGYRAFYQAKNKSPLPLESFQRLPVSHNFFGTFSAKANMTNATPDTIEQFVPHKPYIEKVLYANNTEGPAYHTTYLEKKDKYSYFFNGNQPIVEITSDVKDGSHLLLIRDSFGSSFLPFVPSGFSKVTAIDLRFFHFNINQWIKENHVTDVLVLYGIQSLETDKDLYQLNKKLE